MCAVPWVLWRTRGSVSSNPEEVVCPIRRGLEVGVWGLETVSAWPPRLGDHHCLLSPVDAQAVLIEYKEAAVMGPEKHSRRARVFQTIVSNPTLLPRGSLCPLEEQQVLLTTEQSH